MNFITFLQHRSRHHWLLLLTLVFGVVLATTLLSSGPILVDALMEFGLRRTLLNASLREDIFYLTLRESADQEQYQVTNDQLLNFLNDRLNDQITNLVHGVLRSLPMNLTFHATAIPKAQIRELSW